MQSNWKKEIKNLEFDYSSEQWGEMQKILKANKSGWAKFKFPIISGLIGLTIIGSLYLYVLDQGASASLDELNANNLGESERILNNHVNKNDVKSTGIFGSTDLAHEEGTLRSDFSIETDKIQLEDSPEASANYSTAQSNRMFEEGEWNNVPSNLPASDNTDTDELSVNSSNGSDYPGMNKFNGLENEREEAPDKAIDLQDLLESDDYNSDINLSVPPRIDMVNNILASEHQQAELQFGIDSTSSFLYADLKEANKWMIYLNTEYIFDGHESLGLGTYSPNYMALGLQFRLSDRNSLRFGISRYLGYRSLGIATSGFTTIFPGVEWGYELIDKPKEYITSLNMAFQQNIFNRFYYILQLDIEQSRLNSELKYIEYNNNDVVKELSYKKDYSPNYYVRLGTTIGYNLIQTSKVGVGLYMRYSFSTNTGTYKFNSIDPTVNDFVFPEHWLNVTKESFEAWKTKQQYSLDANKNYSLSFGLNLSYTL